MSEDSVWVRNYRTVRHEAETPMRDHDDDGRCCLRAQLTPLPDEREAGR